MMMKPLTVLALGRGRHSLEATTHKYIQTSGTADVCIAASPDVEVTIAAFNKSKIRVTGHCRKVTIKYASTTAEIDCTELSCNRIQVINAAEGCGCSKAVRDDGTREGSVIGPHQGWRKIAMEPVVCLVFSKRVALRRSVSEVARWQCRDACHWRFAESAGDW